MYFNGKGFTVYAISHEKNWKWQIVLPYGSYLTSSDRYKTAEQAITAGRNWVACEAAFNALGECLGELCHSQQIDQQEYRNLMDSFVSLTR
ncbi:hypothetical protein [Geitlerinema sp. PCC 9228]|jgi:hypothetical protein|uniref:hypothetical protein n=1 Tax=Geitlerinema sp. PCC 9228 TaxID=111611 RepID=UPI0008F9B2F3|nr:hypothetical protein [Geitlerinema sp. PCC 9228]